MDTAQQVYFATVCNHSVCSADEERELIAAAQAGDDFAMNKLVSLNQRLVVHLTTKVSRLYNGDHDFLDLVQFGNLGLLRAIEKFDLKTGGRLSSYAVPWIENSIRRSGYVKGNLVSFSYSEAELKHKIKRAFAELSNALCCEPTIDQIAQYLNIDPFTVKKMLDFTLASLDAETGTGETLGEFIPDETNTEAIAASNVDFENTYSQVLGLFENLTPVEKNVISLRFGLDNHGSEPATYREISKRLSISSTTVKKIEANALGRLRRLVN